MKVIKKLRNAAIKVTVIILFCKLVESYIKNIVEEYGTSAKRFNCYYYLLKQWIVNQRDGVKTTDYLISRGIKKIALYGTGNLCNILYDEIKDDDNIDILYVVDKAGNAEYNGIKCIKPEEIIAQEDVDAVIVTPIYDFLDIYRDLEKYNKDLKIISLEELVYVVNK